MVIKEAVEIFRTESQKLLCDSTERDFRSYSKAVYVISKALKDGYTLCKVGEVMGKMENAKFDSTEKFCCAFNDGLSTAIEILKEACK